MVAFHRLWRSRIADLDTFVWVDAVEAVNVLVPPRVGAAIRTPIIFRCCFGPQVFQPATDTESSLTTCKDIHRNLHVSNSNVCTLGTSILAGHAVR